MPDEQLETVKLVYLEFCTAGKEFRLTYVGLQLTGKRQNNFMLLLFRGHKCADV